MLRDFMSTWAHQWEAVLAASRRQVQPVMLLAGALVLLLWLTGASGIAAQIAGPNRAALVVVHGDGRTVTRCVEFAEAQITGLELVQRSGLDLNLEASGMGASICRLDGEGCTYPGQSCFCQCEGESCVYWSYWRSQAGVWSYSNLGAASTVVTPGAIEGWVWGAGTVDVAKAPPAIAFDAVCAAPTATSTATHTAPPTPTVIPDAESPATATWTPTSTATASATPAPTATAPVFTPAAAPPTSTATETPPPTLPPTPSATPLPVVSEITLPPPVVAAFAADRKEIVAGETVSVRWRVIDAETVTLQAAGKTVSIPAEGELVLAPPQNTTYLLAAANAGGAASTALTVIVRPAPAQLANTPPPTSEPSSAPATAVRSPVSPTMPPAPSPAPATAVATELPMVTVAPTTAPVALNAVTTPASDMAQIGSTAPAQPAITTSLLLTVVGGVAILGIPLVGLAMLLLFMALRRT